MAVDLIERFERADLYVVITGAFCAGRDPVRVLEETLAAGVKLIQLREKGLTDREYLQMAERFRALTERAGALMIVNDRLDLALACGADGVHLGQGDLPIQTARRIAPGLLIGASTHSLEEALAAQEAGTSYVNIGPIFHTATKELARPPLGPEAIAEIVPRLQVPWSTMGGINSTTIDRVLRHGARHPAVVTAVTAAEDVRGAAEELRRRISFFAR